MGSGSSLLGTVIQKLSSREKIFECSRTSCYRSKSNIIEIQYAWNYAIESCDFELIELLIQSTEPTLIHPLHIACKYGQLDVLELITSAGFSIRSIDEEGNTCVHIIASCTSIESPDCCLFLCLENRMVVNDKNHIGNTPLHIALNHNNIPLVKVLMQCGAKATLKNNSGISPIDQVRSSDTVHHKELLSLLQNPRTKSIPRNDEKPVDIDKIMLIWDRFFENANDPQIMGQYMYQKSNALQGISDSKTNTHTSGENLNKQKTYWFHWILVYQPDSDSEEYIYKVYHKTSLKSMTLQSLLQSQDKNHSKSLDYRLMTDGWIDFYDFSSNTSSWLNIYTNQIESFLSINRNDSNDISMELSSLKDDYRNHYYEQNMFLISSNQLFSHAWCHVNNGNSKQGYYYHNYLLNCSQWNEPMNWREYIDKEQEGWLLCCEENDMNLYWWNEYTNLSKWLD